MIRFVDGPAAGTNLVLKRAPFFLRVVREPGGQWDALDQLDDTPGRNESIVVYRRRGNAGWMHLNRPRRNGGHVMCAAAEYSLVEPHPEEDDIRTTERWRAWCVAQQNANT